MGCGVESWHILSSCGGLNQAAFRRDMQGTSPELQVHNVKHSEGIGLGGEDKDNIAGSKVAR